MFRCALFLLAVGLRAQDAEVNILPVQGNIYMLVGAGGNITVQIGNDGVLLVDTGLAPMSGKVLAAVRKLSDKPIRYIINTHVHGDHTGGNEAISKAGGTIAGGNVTFEIGDADRGAAILAHENLLQEMSAAKPPVAPRALPTDSYFGDEKELYFNGESIKVLHQPAAHTGGDSLVYFRRSDVVSTGDIFTTTGYPFIDIANGGSINGIVDSLNRIIEITVPADKQEGGTYVIPGHGRLCDEADVVEYRDMVTILRDRIRDLVKKGMTLEQVKAAKPTSDYDPRYGNPDRFVEGAYNSLKK
jgi:cyclase